MKHKRSIAILLAAMMAMSAMSVTAFAASDAVSGATAASEGTTEESSAKHSHGKHRKKEKVAEPEDAIGKGTAKEKALTDAGLTAEQVEKIRSKVSETEEGTVIYKVRFTFEGQRYKYKIDAVSGEILDKSVTDASEAGSHSPKAKESSVESAAISS